MHDPFALLGIYDDFSPSRVSTAFAATVRSGTSVADARRAMDTLRDERRRAAAEMLAPSMTQEARRARTEPPPTAAVTESVTLLLQFLRVAVEELDAELSRSAARPSLQRDLCTYLPPLTDYLRP